MNDQLTQSSTTESVKLLRTREVAEVMGCSESSVKRLIASGELPSIVVGGMRRVPLVKLQEWLDAQIKTAG